MKDVKKNGKIQKPVQDWQWLSLKISTPLAEKVAAMAKATHRSKPKMFEYLLDTHPELQNGTRP